MEMRVGAMFFSGTGTTEKVVRAVADRLCQAGQSLSAANLRFVRSADIDFTPSTARRQVYSFSRQDIIVFGTPVIAGRVPNVLLKFLDTLQGGGAMAIPVVLYGNRNFDDALIELRNILEAKDFRTVAAGAFIGEHSFSRTLAAGRPNDKDMETAAGFAELAAGWISGTLTKVYGDIGGEARESEVLDALQTKLMNLGPIPVDGEDPIRPYYKPRDRQGNHIDILKVKPKLDADKCSGCGTCVLACPMGSIKADAPGQVQGICIKCCGCVKKCPQEALYFDDPGFLYHKKELELEYSEPKTPSLYIRYDS